ncbi:unnamed protein product [Ranitomeya imitator]|uniref:Uncharacterized protein n=1 Tax=Ranitomeya imitator TaxID=111125 RepID=A0ABN9MEM7_9NEOB|nr:unnamed protein product [Ranitomeya imitator]
MHPEKSVHMQRAQGRLQDSSLWTVLPERVPLPLFNPRIAAATVALAAPAYGLWAQQKVWRLARPLQDLEMPIGQFWHLPEGPPPAVGCSLCRSPFDVVTGATQEQEKEMQPQLLFSCKHQQWDRSRQSGGSVEVSWAGGREALIPVLEDAGLRVRGLVLEDAGLRVRGKVLEEARLRVRGLVLEDAGLRVRGLVLEDAGLRVRGSVLEDAGLRVRGLVLEDAGLRVRGSVLEDAGLRVRGSVLEDAGLRVRGSVLEDAGLRVRGSVLEDAGLRVRGLVLEDAGLRSP